MQTIQQQTYELYFDSRSYNTQPKNVEMAKITEGIKQRLTRAQRPYTLDEALQKFGSGYSGLGVTCRLEGSKICFHESKLLFIDVDDDHEVTNPKEVMNKTGAAGLFYTFSHGKKGNRYRLVFTLSEIVRDESLYKHIGERYAKYLIENDIPADEQPTRNLSAPIRGGQSGYHINPEAEPLDVDLYRASYEVETEKVERRASFIHNIGFKPFSETLEHRIFTFGELQEACEAIGHIPSGLGMREEWARLMYAIGSYYRFGYISITEALDLARIISGDEMDADDVQRSYLERANRVTIGTLVKAAKEKGWAYRRSITKREAEQYISHRLQAVEHRGVEYLAADDVKRILDAPERRSLIVAPTGSGKTYAAMEAIKSRVSHSSNEFYIFTAPTRALAKQVQSQYGGFLLIGRTRGEQEETLRDAVKKGERVIVSTFDKCGEAADFVGRQSGRAVVIVDEIHQLVTAYSYRARQLTALSDTLERPLVSKVIGITGTPSPLRLNDFEAVYTLEMRKPVPVAKRFLAYHYDFTKEFEALLIKTIETRLKQGVKMLVFLNNIDVAKRVRKEVSKNLPDKRIYALSSHLKYKTGEDTEKSDEAAMRELERITRDSKSEADCILTTSLLTDGVSIAGNETKFETLVVINGESNFFDESQVVQAANRLRERYSNFSVMVQTPKNEEKRDTSRFFDVEAEKADMMGRSVLIKSELEKMSGLLRLEEIENSYGVRVHPFRNELAINHLVPLYRAHKAKSAHYRGWRFSYVTAIGRALNLEPTFIDLKKAFLEEGLGDELEETTTWLEHAKELAQLDNKAKAENVERILTKELYDSFVTEDLVMLKEAKAAMTAYHYTTARSHASLLSFEAWKKQVVRVTRKNEANNLKRCLEAVVSNVWSELDLAERKKRRSKSIQVYEKLKNEQMGEERESQEWNVILSGYAKELRLKLEDVEVIFEGRFVIKETRRTKQSRFKTLIRPIDKQYIIEEFGLDEENAEKALKSISEK